MSDASFYDELRRWPGEEVSAGLAHAPETAARGAVAAAERGEALTPRDFMALLSPAAAPLLEDMARAAQAITLRQFGRSVQLFTPLYLANYCTNRCVYCGFNTGNRIRRSMLSPEEIEREGRAIAATGLRHILLLTGDAPKKTGPEYIAEAARRLRAFFPGIGVEVYAMSVEEYRLLTAAGVDSLTMFQETYNEELYAGLHPAGPKRDFRFRLDAPQRGAEAGMRCIGIGALLGLDEWRRDAFFSGLHAAWLQERYPAVELSLSVPRMRPHAGVFDRVFSVSDRDLVQYITALRLFLPAAGITVSSRERAFLRDRLIELGVTRVSAGVSTAVGGHAVASAAEHSGGDAPDVGQFDISDSRSVDEMAAAIRARGYQPVFKHWEPLEGASYACGRN